MSRRRSATGWSAGATVLTFTGSLAGSAAGAVAVAAGGVAVAASLAAGAVTVSAGLVSAGLGSAAFAAGPGSVGLSSCLGCVRHRGGGVHLEVADGRRRDVGGFGTGDCCVDRELGGAGARRGRLRRQCRGRGHREESCRDGHQYAVKSCTVRRTVTHRHTPLGELPRHGTVVRYHSSRLAREAPARSVSQSYACTPRFKRRRYMCPSHAASAMRDNSRQTDLKLPVRIRVACFCHAPRLLSVTAKPRFESFRTADVVGLPRSLPLRAP